MKIAYLILAHNTPNHLRRLVAKLQHPDSHFFIHIDRKSNLSEFTPVNSNNVFLANNRVPVYWGDFSEIRATLGIMRQALNMDGHHDYFVLLSGSDYPLRSNEYIHQFFETHKGAEFINMVRMPNAEVGKPISLLTSYKLDSRKVIIEPVRGIINRLLKHLFQRDYKKHIGNLEPYAGSQWWALTKAACEYIIEFVKSKPHVVSFFVNTVVPEEMFFQTILGNSSFKRRVKRSLTYADWSTGIAHPAVIGEGHISYLESRDRILANDAYGEGELLFARKFPDDSERLVERIDKTFIH